MNRYEDEMVGGVVGYEMEKHHLQRKANREAGIPNRHGFLMVVGLLAALLVMAHLPGYLSDFITITMIVLVVRRFLGRRAEEEPQD